LVKDGFRKGGGRVTLLLEKLFNVLISHMCVPSYRRRF